MIGFHLSTFPPKDDMQAPDTLPPRPPCAGCRRRLDTPEGVTLHNLGCATHGERSYAAARAQVAA